MGPGGSEFSWEEQQTSSNNKVWPFPRLPVASRPKALWEAGDPERHPGGGACRLITDGFPVEQILGLEGTARLKVRHNVLFSRSQYLALAPVCAQEFPCFSLNFWK